MISSRASKLSWSSVAVEVVGVEVVAVEFVGVLRSDRIVLVRFELILLAVTLLTVDFDVEVFAADFVVVLAEDFEVDAAVTASGVSSIASPADINEF